MDQRLFKGLMDSKQLVGKEVLTSLQELSREYPIFNLPTFFLQKHITIRNMFVTTSN